MKQIQYIAIAGTLAFTACDSAKKSAEAVSEDIIGKITSQTIDLEYLNTDVRPQDDFFEFSNGTWIKTNPVPPSESFWGSFNELDQSNKNKLTNILKEAQSANAETGSMQQILGDYYASFTDMETRDSKGYESIQADLEQIEAMNSKKDLVEVIAQHHIQGIGSLFGFGVGQDLKDVDHHISYFSQGGIGLPNRDYYFSEDKKEILQKYEIHIAKMVRLVGVSEEEAPALAKSVVEFEKSLAEVMMAPAALRVPENTYNKFSKKMLLKHSGNFDFDRYLSMIGSLSFDSLIVSQPKFLDKIAYALEKTALNDWKNYLTWMSVLSRAQQEKFARST